MQETDKPAEPASRDTHFWLMKAEPDSRVVKGKDVKFSVDDFEAVGTSAWEGVRNYTARGFMRDQMKLGDRVLFYHSSCKVPGVAAIAEVIKEGYPDHTAWDPEHPYYDEKTDKDKPRWFMVDVRFVQRVQHLVPLSVLKTLPQLEYLDEDCRTAIQAMQLLNNSRLSVQPVSKAAYEAILLMGERGGFEVEKAKPRPKAKKRKVDEDDEDEPEAAEDDENPEPRVKAKKQKASEGTDASPEAGDETPKTKPRRRKRQTVPELSKHLASESQG